MRCLSFLRLFSLILLSATAGNSFAQSNADEQAGATLYRDKGCPQCHGADLKGNKKGHAIDTINNDPAWPAEKITKQIRDGGQKMPPFGDSLTDPEIAQLVAYLRAKDRPAPTAATPSSN